MFLRALPIVVFLVNDVLCQTGTDLVNLKNQLFTTNNYDKEVRPRTDQDHTVPVAVDFALVGINDLSDTDQQLTTTGYLTMKWTDELLVWSPATYNGLDSILVPQNEVWRPDITLDNGMESKSALGQKFIQVTITNAGLVKWEPYEVFVTACSLDIKHFPFDKQTCSVMFSTWMNAVNQVNLTIGTTGFIKSNFEKNGKWEIESMATSSDYSTTRSVIEFTLNLKRKSSFYVLFLILPAILLGVLNAFTYVLPAGSGEKVGYTVTVFLSYAIFYTILSESLPKNSDTVSTVGAYLFFMMVLSAVATMITLIELRLYDRDEGHRVPKWVIRFVKTILHRSCMCVCCVKLDDPGDGDMEENWTKIISPWMDVNWKDFVDALDFVLFWIFMLIIFVFTILVFILPINYVALF